MGVMKRLEDWRRYYPPLPQPLRAFAGLEPHRDPEAFKERKRAEREALKERKAIQAIEALEDERLRIEAKVRDAMTRVIRAALDGDQVDDTADPPRLAAAGWYRVGSTFYRIGSGPHPAFYAVRDRPTVERREPAKLQLSLFN